MRLIVAGFICTAVIFIILKTPQTLDGSKLAGFNRDLKNYNANLQISDGARQVVIFKIAVADTDHKKMYGLMNLDYLPYDYGMLFPSFTSQLITMWMKNTRIPLDMIFIDADDEIATIKTDAKPYSLEIISSEKEVKKVLEINAGLAKKLGIKVGQKVRIFK